MPGTEWALLTARAARGDSTAFEELVLASQGMVYHLALRMTGKREDALDVSQEAFLKAWRALPAFRAESNFTTWMYRITLNAAKDYLAAKNRHATESLEDEPERWESDPGADPAATLLKSEQSGELRRALDKLSPEHREIFVLRDVEGYSYEEIASMLSLESGTVKSRLSRARAELRRLFREAEQK